MSVPASVSWLDLPGAPAIGARLCALADIADGGARLIILEALAGQAPFGVIVLRSGESVRAYVNRCAHFGIPLAEKPQHLIFTSHESITCNVHYSRYRWHDGVCEKGECAGQALIPVPVAVDHEGRVIVAG